MIEECGFQLSDSQTHMLLDIENSFKRSERSDWNVKLKPKDIHTLIRQVSSREKIDDAKKGELENLYGLINEHAGKIFSKNEVKN